MQRPIARTLLFLNGTGNAAWSYGFNPAGQIASVGRDNDAYAWTGHYAVNRAYTTNGLNQYSAAGSAAFAYDPNGNLISDGSRTYLYDVENRMVAGNGAALVYDPLGRLFQVSSAATGTTRFLYDGDALVAEYDGSNAMLRRHVHWPGADLPMTTYEGAGLDTPRQLFSDHQGSIVAFADENGANVAVNRYDEYGIPAAANTGRFQYTGQVWLPELGMYHYKARIYSPTLGRFMQVDPTGYDDGANMYAYVGDDPVNRVDPDGRTAALVIFCPPCWGSGPLFGVVGTIEAIAMSMAPRRDPANPPTLAGDSVRPQDHPATPHVPSRAPDGAPVEPGTGPRGQPGFRGRPGTWQSGPRQDRKYGPDGFPQTDVDYPSAGGRHGAPSPHAQDWGRPPRGGPPTGADRGHPRRPTTGERFSQPARNPDGHLPPHRGPRRSSDPH